MPSLVNEGACNYLYIRIENMIKRHSTLLCTGQQQCEYKDRKKKIITSD